MLFDETSNGAERSNRVACVHNLLGNEEIERFTHSFSLTATHPVSGATTRRQKAKDIHNNVAKYTVSSRLKMNGSYNSKSHR